MKLLLTSGGITNEKLKQSLLKLIGKNFNETNLVFIPTAANVEAGGKEWLIDNLSEFKNLGFASVDIVDISAIPTEMWKKRLEDADVLVFGGGNTAYLNKWVQESGLKDSLPEMLKDKVYVGISAGSMIAAKDLTLSDSKELYEEEVGGFDDVEGIGLVDFQTRPHYKSPFFPKVTSENLTRISKNIKQALYALDDNSGIEVCDGEISVVSEGEWDRFN